MGRKPRNLPTPLTQPVFEPLRAIKQPAFIEVESVADLGRLACALERAPLPLFAISDGSKYIISTQLDIFLGIPIFYYANSPETKHYLAYKTTATGEEVSLQDSPGNPTFMHAPVIEVVKLPKLFEKGMHSSGGSSPKSKEKFLSMQVKDLTSLVKVASYKILFEEPPLPIFAFPSATGSSTWKIGSFTRIEEYEEASIFFFYENSKPEQNFVGYSMTRTNASLTNRTDEHGSLYVKIIRLKEPHPMVEPI